MRTLVLLDKDIQYRSTGTIVEGAEGRLILKTPKGNLDIIGNTRENKDELCYIRQLERALDQKSWYRYHAVYSRRFIDWIKADKEHVLWYNIALGRKCLEKNS